MDKLLLPPEIWVHVISFIPARALYRLYAVNRVFFDVIMSRKYRHVTLDGEETRSLARKLECLRNAAISHRVESIHLQLGVVYNEASVSSSHAASGKPALVIDNGDVLIKNSSVNPGSSKSRDRKSSASCLASRRNFSKDILAVITSLSQLTCLHIEWRIFEAFTPLDTESLWRAVASRLQALTITTTTTGLNTIFHPSISVIFPQLSSLHLTLLYRNSAEDETIELRAAQLTLARFLNTLQDTLQSLHINPSPPHDLTLFWEHVGHFPCLADLDIDITLPPLSSFDSDMPLHPATYDFVRLHRNSIESLTIYASRLPVFRKQHPAEWESKHHYVFPRLRSLSVDTNIIVGRHQRLNGLLRRQTFILESYEVVGTISPGELEEQLAIFRDTPCGTAILTSLSVSIYRLDLKLLFKLQSDLPVLQTLKLRVMHIANGSSAPITPGQFFPLKLPPHEDVHAFVKDMINCTELRNWPLRDIVVIRQSCCRELTLWKLMQLFAMCIPTIVSFAGTRPMDVPDPTDSLELFNLSQCSTGNHECFYGKDGIDASPQ